mmetsp:Transcript_27464/g.51258  ORF Transcript_27464/g.51258 Transcript_27464/m.51258 type:complete len:133 (-) Transcript_27464:158-556(-)
MTVPLPTQARSEGTSVFEEELGFHSHLNNCSKSIITSVKPIAVDAKRDHARRHSFFFYEGVASPMKGWPHTSNSVEGWHARRPCSEHALFLIEGNRLTSSRVGSVTPFRGQGSVNPLFISRGIASLFQRIAI